MRMKKDYRPRLDGSILRPTVDPGFGPPGPSVSEEATSVATKYFTADGTEVFPLFGQPEQITLRDHLAGYALIFQGIESTVDRETWIRYDALAMSAYQLADAMLKARRE